MLNQKKLTHDQQMLRAVAGQRMRQAQQQAGQLLAQAEMETKAIDQLIREAHQAPADAGFSPDGKIVWEDETPGGPPELPPAAHAATAE